MKVGLLQKILAEWAGEHSEFAMKKTKLDIVTKELLAIAGNNGGLLLPQTVVESARPIRSPLHSRFEWDDSTAGEKYRIWQARQLIRVAVEMIPGMASTTEVFVSLSSDRIDGNGYRIQTEVFKDEDLRNQLLQDALDELEIFKIKYRRLVELNKVFSAIKAVKRKTIKKLR